MTMGKTALFTVIAASVMVSLAMAEPYSEGTTGVQETTETTMAAETTAVPEPTEPETEDFYVPPYLNPAPIDALKPYVEANDSGETLPAGPKASEAAQPAPEKEPFAAKLLWGIGGIIVGFILFALLGKAPSKANPKHPRFPKPDEPPEKEAAPEELDKYTEHANLYTRLILNTFKTEADTLRSIQGRTPESEFLRLSILSRLSEHAEALAKTNARLRFFDSLRCGTFQLKKINVDINTVLEKCAKAFGAVSVIPYAAPLYAQIDYVRFSEAVDALLENAVKYGAAGAPASVSISAKPSENGRILITISDKGPGMEKIVANSMLCTFEEFQKSFTDESGAGLGIKFAETVVRLNGGELWFISKIGEGFSALISIPAVTVSKDQAS